MSEESEPYAPWGGAPRLSTEDGAERRIGVEMEFIGPSVDEAATVVHRLYGGEIRREDNFRYKVVDTVFGDFRVDLDMKFAHRRPEGGHILSPEVDAELRRFAGRLGAEVLPTEIACPPIPISRAGALDQLVDSLRGSGARGTSGSVFYAFGAQLNPEAPSLSAESIFNHLRAFLLLKAWLREEIQVDASRRLLLFAQPFPKAYERQILTAPAAPDMATLIDEYIAQNPTRNRELDMLPLMRWIDEERVMARLPYETINARPTYHYRLPNMAIEDPTWTIRVEWERWVKVERLAARPETIDQLAWEWRRADQSLIEGWTIASRAIADII